MALLIWIATDGAVLALIIYYVLAVLCSDKYYYQKSARISRLVRNQLHK